MDAIEPKLDFTALVHGVPRRPAAVAFLVVAGMFPLRSPPGLRRNRARRRCWLLENAVLLVVLLTGTGWYGYAELRWSTLIVVGGLVVLFAPGLFRGVAAAGCATEAPG